MSPGATVHSGATNDRATTVPLDHESDTMTAPAVGRRERKRLETRQTLVAAAIKLFAEKGFDNATVTDIAERADVDASTFFRHFGSKEAVLFTDMSDFTERLADELERRPADEPLFDAIVATLLGVVANRPFDSELEFLRGKLTQSSPALQAQSLVYRERLVNELARAIARRLDTDPTTDARPYLAATIWAAALDFYRRRAVTTATSRRAANTALGDILDEVLDMLRPIWPTGAPWS
jgi:AcrR family transcriptional regulator